MSTSIIGQIISAAQVENAVEETLRTWFVTYLREMERQTGREPGALPHPRTYTHHNEFVNWPEEMLPCVVIVSPGQPTAMTKLNSVWRGTWTIGIGIVVSARDKGATRELSKLYVAAARTALLQHPSLGGFAIGIASPREAYDDLPSADTRTLGGGQLVLEVEVDSVTDPKGAPLAPAPDPEDPPPSEWPAVETVEVDIEREGV